ncbi:glycosyltransferase family 2 protein [Candidatus Margulisiibacteriota bacterium]
MENLISIIVRTKNEERWITPCLKAVFAQNYKNFEVILVDNESTDKTVEKAKQFELAKVVVIKQFLPGKALNMGIEHAKGKYIVCLSGHCVPVNNQWLSNLVRNFDDDSIAGVYGRQEPMSYTSDFDKRDLLITFGLDRRVQEKDSFFHNANSMIRKSVLDQIPFDDLVTNIEDRLWAEMVLRKSYKLVYEPEASVYHYHGIHQNRDPQRCYNIVRIIEKTTQGKNTKTNSLEIENMNVVAIIPVKGKPLYIGKVPLLKYTIDRIRESQYVSRIIVSTDNKQTAKLAEELGAEVPFMRPPEYSQEHVDLEKVYQYTLNELENNDIYPDLLILLESTFPFRAKGFIDNLIMQAVSGGLDSVIPTKQEFNSCWTEENGSIKRMDEGFIPRKFKQPIYIGYKGLGCVTQPWFVREGKMFGPNMGIINVSNPHELIEVRDTKDIAFAETIIESLWE